jgi:pheromone shutdown protein TraB
MLEVVDQHVQQEIAAIEERRRGSVMATVGKVLLWMDLILVCFVYAGLRVGSHLFLWWVLGEGLVGLVLLAFGTHKKSHAQRRLAMLTPPISGEYRSHA